MIAMKRKLKNMLRVLSAMELYSIEPRVIYALSVIMSYANFVIQKIMRIKIV